MDTKTQRQIDHRAHKELVRPVAPRIAIARVLAASSGVLAVAPYIALVQIGALLVEAALQGTAVNASEVERWLLILAATFTLRLLLYFIALLITHHADIRLGYIIRRKLVTRLSCARLMWFTENSSGRVRKALQDDISAIHNLIAHRPVEITNAIVMPLALMAYAFFIDWRLGLLAISLLPLYALAMSVSMRGMGEKTVEMDAKLALVSSRMVEFVSGITVVKAFGRVGARPLCLPRRCAGVS